MNSSVQDKYSLTSPTRRADLSDELADLVPSDHRDGWQAERDRLAQRRAEAHRCLRWSEPITGALPNGLGSYRLFFPWFELEQGACLDFFALQDGEQALELAWNSQRHEAHGIGAWCPFVMAWFGMQADHDRESIKMHILSGVIEVDWLSPVAATLEVSRNQLQPSEAAHQSVKDLARRLRGELEKFAKDHSQSRFGLYNAAKLEIEPPAAEQWHWLYQHKTEPRFEWRPLQFPVLATEHWMPLDCLPQASTVGANKYSPV